MGERVLYRWTANQDQDQLVEIGWKQTKCNFFSDLKHGHVMSRAHVRVQMKLARVQGAIPMINQGPSEAGAGV